MFAALVFLYRDAGRGKRVVWMLTVRVALSVSLVAFLVLSYYMGWIGPGGIVSSSDNEKAARAHRAAFSLRARPQTSQ